MAQPKILFSAKPEWEEPFRRNLGGWDIHFLPFADGAAPLDLRPYDVVLPLTLDAARYLNWRHAAELPGRAIVPPDAAIALFDDKPRFAAFLVEQGYAGVVPRIGLPQPYPYVVKPRIGAWGEGVHIVSDAASAHRHAALLNSADHFVQACVLGANEYTTHLMVDQGRITWGRTIEFTYATDRYVKGGGAQPLREQIVEHRALWPLFERIAQRATFEGLCCVNYKMHEGGPRIFELNPRVGGSLTLHIGDAVAAYARAVAARRAAR